MSSGRLFLVVTWNGGGVETAARGIATALLRRGHTVKVLGHRSQEPRFRCRGVPFAPYENTPDWDASAPLPHEVRRDRLRKDVLLSPGLGAAVQHVVDLDRPDLTFVDATLMGALSALEAAGAPSVGFTQIGYGYFSSYRGAILDPLNELRTGLGLDEVASPLDAWSACRAVLIGGLPELDSGHATAPDLVHHTGPIFDDQTRPVLPRASAACGGRPVVVVSMGAVFQEWRDRLVSRVVEALSRLDVVTVATVGSTEMVGAVRATPAQLVYDFVPLSVLLPQATLLISHGGPTTMYEALAYGVPMICLGRPDTDQAYNARQLQASGAGRMASQETGSAELEHLVRHMLEDQRYAERAATLARRIGELDGATKAAELAETLT